MYPTAVFSREKKSWREIKQWHKTHSQVHLTAGRVGLLTANNGGGWFDTCQVSWQNFCDAT